MRPVLNLSVIPGCIMAAVLLSSCNGGGECGGDGASAPCPPPIYGWARVDGQALRHDGTPLAGERALVVCPEGVGAYDSPTDTAGDFRVFLTYSVADTLLHPFPPRQADGSFTVNCRVSLELASDALLVHDPLEVLFTPTQAGIVPTQVELQEETP